MTDDDLNFLPLKVTKVGATGKRTFDTDSKRRLLQACRRPGVSISGMALKAGINANQLHKWMRDDEREAALAGATKPDAPAFMPVLTLGEIGRSVQTRGESKPVERRTAVAPMPPVAAPARLRAQLPNGVTLELECGIRDGGLVKAMVQALGAG